MGRKKSFESVQISLRLPEYLFYRLKALARREAILRDSDVSYADLVRDALAEAYPEDPQPELPRVYVEGSVERGELPYDGPLDEI